MRLYIKTTRDSAGNKSQDTTHRALHSKYERGLGGHFRTALLVRMPIAMRTMISADTSKDAACMCWAAGEFGESTVP